jgi:hypothetical protein
MKVCYNKYRVKDGKCKLFYFRNICTKSVDKNITSRFFNLLRHFLEIFPLLNCTNQAVIVVRYLK